MTHPSEEEVRGLVERLLAMAPAKAIVCNERSTASMCGDIRQAADALESQQRAYLALSERVGVKDQALKGLRDLDLSLPSYARKMIDSALTGDKQGGDALGYGADRALVASATEPVSRLGPAGFDHGESK